MVRKKKKRRNWDIGEMATILEEYYALPWGKGRAYLQAKGITTSHLNWFKTCLCFN